MELNPIVAREFLARWRGFRAFALLFCYSALLAGGIGFIYAYGRDTEHAAARGHELFRQLTWIQTLGWMLLAPALTATSIAGERERGLLEQVQLSPLSAWRIAWGKLLSALLMIGLLLAVPLPVIAICFFLGGVSPAEFGAALALQAATAATCATIGLFCSAWCRRSNVAMALAFATVFGWGISSFIALVLAEIGKAGGFSKADVQGTVWALLDLSKTSALWDLLSFYSSSNPVYAAVSLSELVSSLPAPSLLTVMGDIPLWALCIALQTWITLFLLWLAARALRKPFVEQYWYEVSKRRRKHKPKTLPAPTPTENETPKSRVRPLHWELPLASRIAFANPILQREIRGKLRLRRVSPFFGVILTIIFLWLLYDYCTAVYHAFMNSYNRVDTWWAYSGLALLAIAPIAAVMSAGAFTRERELGTQEALLLSLMKPVEIISGKLMATLLICGVAILPLVPLMIPTIRHVSPVHNVYNGLDDGVVYDGVAPGYAVVALLLIFATAWCYTIWGMMLSWLCRRTAVATIWTLGTLFAANAFLPPLIDLYINRPYSSYYSGEAKQILLYCWHPFLAFSWMTDTTRHPPLAFALLVCAVLFITGCGLMVLLMHLMQDAPRERDHSQHSQPGRWLYQKL
ncbi:MAG: ABC transporter permease [Abitibacteriaceae bacterium]|nr:ABC transporter permease [Abditibacteriaceae bacterium]